MTADDKIRSLLESRDPFRDFQVKTRQNEKMTAPSTYYTKIRIVVSFPVLFKFLIFGLKFLKSFLTFTIFGNFRAEF